MKSNYNILCLLVGVMLAFQACKKFIEVDAPSTSINTDNVYDSDQTASSVLTGIYTNMSANFATDGLTTLNVYPELSADNLVAYVSTDVKRNNYYKNQLSPQTVNPHFWSKIYPFVFVTNAAIEGLNSSTKLSPEVKSQLLGESKFLRAFFYFYLVNLYGDVPLTITTDYTVNNQLTRSSASDVYSQMIKDLNDATVLLNSTYVGGDAKPLITAERVRPNKDSAKALLARIYLFNKDYPNAEKWSTEVISNKSTYDTVSLNNVFLKNSKEAIWQLQPVRTSENTSEGNFLTIPAAGPSTVNPVYLNSALISSFQPTDKRLANWIGSVVIPEGRFYYPRKYKVSTLNQPVTEYSIVMRLGEQYLIRAEARAQQGNSTGALEDLNLIRKRAGLPSSGVTDREALLDLILQERQKELFTEWGHRWLDLKRTNKADVVLGAIKTTWQPEAKLYPIPETEILRNGNLIQNPGYTQ